MATPKNSTIPRLHSTHDFTQTQISSLIWSVGAGSLIGTFPFSFLYTKFGARYIFLAAGVISIVATALTPLAVSLGLWCFIGVRFLVGLAYSADFAAIGLLCSRWGSLKQQALFISVLTCYSPLSR
ncbi:MFS domain-containing protein [Aphelenchoides fujianensis]|nr:MFS domain-containing protein [Aphelenchoides fujianensis]